MMDRQFMVERIDIVADAQRARIAGDPVKVFEYQAAEEGARAFAATGFAGDAPSVVASWAAARGWTNQAAAENILAEAAQFRGALEYIRATRLAGKYAVMGAVTDEAAEAAFNQAIAQLKAVGG
jgi:hypothetical protein